MKVIYWNIGKDLGQDRLKHLLVKSLINEMQPDILCVAEGTKSVDDCKNLLSTIKKEGYNLYYSPTFVHETKYELNYPYKSEGLKIFFKETIVLKQSFTFDLQKENGRIVAMHKFVNEELLTLIFIHNYSKGGSKKVADNQISFISNLSEWIHLPGGIVQKSQKHIIMGDFNLEPWDHVLRNDHYKSLNSFFLTKHFEQEKKKRKGNGREFYFNSLVEHLIPNEEINLGGTYYNSKHGWALFDYAMSSKNCSSNIEIISKIGLKSLIDLDRKKGHDFLKYGLDWKRRSN